jgi:hypothetical protein
MKTIQQAERRKREWLYVVTAGLALDSSWDLAVSIFDAWKLGRGDTVYLFRPVKSGSVLFG